MQATFQAKLKMAGLAAVMAVAAALLIGCGESAKPMSPQNEAKYREMMQSGNTTGALTKPAGGTASTTGGGGGGGNAAK